MQQQHYQTPVQPKWVWYGADLDTLDKILQHGFAVTPSPTHGRVLGHGIYLAKDVSESLCFARRKGDNQQHVLLCELYVTKTEAVSPHSQQFQAKDPPSEAALCNGVYGLASTR